MIVPNLITTLDGKEVMVDFFTAEVTQNRTIHIIGEITDDTAAYICSEIRYLSRNSKEPLTLILNSPGGSISAGMAIYDTLNASGCEVTTVVKAWYDGYRFGNTEIFNPWSVINYISKGCVPQAYWVNTGKNEILEDVLKVADEDITEKLYSLILGDKVLARIDLNGVYGSSNIFSLLLVAGYLKTTIKELQADGSYLCQVSIPNKEIASVYKSEVLAHLMQIGAVSRTTADKIAESLFLNDYVKLEKAISEYMNKAISFYDTVGESFYHGLILGLIATMDTQYKIKSNRESGNGRFDIALTPRDDRYPGIIMELKWKKGLSEENLAVLANEAVSQIDRKKYDSGMRDEGIHKVLKFGIAFSGKKVSVKTK